ncbi:MAG: GDSL-type esterase/lipase family protein [Gemmataceae bacterium]|nr:GDSL-type esterase/lipase family protein [Gemmataceae bacterium]
MKSPMRLAVVAVTLAIGLSKVRAQPPATHPFLPGDRVVFLGDTFAEREAMFGYIETVLQTRLPELKLTFRNLGYSADTPAVHLADIAKGDIEYNHGSNRALNFGTMPKHLADAKADVIVMCFGMTDSFRGPAGVEAFKKELQELIDYHKKQKYNGKSAPRFILVGPIAHEKLGGEFPDPAEHNKSLKLYNEAIRQVAAKNKTLFVDLFGTTSYGVLFGGPRRTLNGIHATQQGHRSIAQIVIQQLGLAPVDNIPEQLRALVAERNQQFFYKWRAVNGEYIYGRRAKPFGVVNFPGEMSELDRICAKLDTEIHDFSRASPAQTPGQAVAQVNKQKQGVIGGQEFPTAKDPAEAIKHFKLQDGYEINLFASEKEFPLHNPLAIAWDAKGRLWITTMPSYPHYLPGAPPDDKIIILEDTDGDGKADKHTVFADKLYLPTGIEFGNGGVYVGAQPNMLFLKDTDGDGKADYRETILHGLGSGDSHHAVHMFTWTPDGALLFHEGIFHRSNVETPWGPLRQRDAGIYRFQPKSHKLETFVSYHFANPWGHVFDKWGQNFIADASGGANYFGLPLTGHVEFPRQHPNMKVFTSIVRPTCGCELIASRHFPESAQGNFLVNNNIGFQGIKQHQVVEEGSGFTSKELEPLLFSTDRNFRPVGISFGPDGALYIVDWFNPLIGHMQFSLRDPGRDHYHGRIWRITAKGRPLVKAPTIAGEPVSKLLDLLKEYEDRTRYRVRAELRERKADEVAPALEQWIKGLDESDADYEHHLLEALWVCQNAGVVREDLLARLLNAKDYRARAAATRALRHWRDRLPQPKVYDWLAGQVEDVHPRVRLEAVVALSFFKDARAAEIALLVVKHPTDYYLDYGIRETLTTLEPYWKPAIAKGQPFATNNPAGSAYVLGSVSNTELTQMPRSAPVYVALLSRDNILPQFREEALHGLAKINKTDFLTELFATMERIDRGGHGQSEMVLHDLGHLLSTRPAGELATQRPRIEKLAAAAKMAMTRQVAYVALITADKSIDRTWSAASQNLNTLVDVVDSISILPDGALRAASYPKVKELLHGVPKSLENQVKAARGTRGRYVRIDVPGSQRVLTLAEVEVFSRGENIAGQGEARQSSTDQNAPAARALDGNKSGVFADRGQTHTRQQKDPWWELDLREERAIDSIVIWTRSEQGGKYVDRLQNFKLTVFDGHKKPVWIRENQPAPRDSARFALDANPAERLRHAAMNAVVSIPGHEAEVFATLARFVSDGIDRDAAIRALRRLPKNKLPKDQLKPLAEAILAHVGKLPAKERTEPNVLDELQLGSDLAGLLGDDGKALAAQLGKLGVQVVLIRTIPHNIAYDVAEFYVEAGKPVVIVLENPDVMPHNLVISQPGSLTEVGQAAELLATNPNAFAMGFVPKHPKVLFASRLLQPRESDRMQITAPATPGNYVFVCTFPGHYPVMNGIMRVVPDLSVIPSTERVKALEDKKWKVAELAADLAKLDAGRSFARGKELFKLRTCVQCHKIGGEGEGGALGPDLSELPKKLAGKDFTRTHLLTELLEPSKVIDKKFKVWRFLMDDGRPIDGIILEETKTTIKIAKNAVEKPMDIKVDAIEAKVELKNSFMPEGLLGRLNREDILDLLAYLAAGGEAEHPAFRK